MTKKQEIKNKMNKSPGGLCCISVDRNGVLSSPVFGDSGPTDTVTIYRDSVEDLLKEIDVMSMHLKKRYGSPYGNQTCNWS